MNERIKELAEQARKEFLELPTGYKAEQVGMYPQLMENFAKLIVGECCKIVEPTSHHEAFAQSYMGGVDGLELLGSKVKQIKERFGVEE